METTKKPAAKKRSPLPIILGVLACIGLFFGYRSYNYGKHHVDTDDAQVDGNIAPVLARTSGYIQKINFVDNQKVKMGDILITLDTSELAAKTEQSEASVINAEANLAVIQANIMSANAQVATAEANAETAKTNIETAIISSNRNIKELKRFEMLLADKSVSQQQYDNVKAQQETSALQVEAGKKQLSAAKAQVTVAISQLNAAKQQTAVANATVRQRKADLNLSKLQQSYVTLSAPVSGTISRRNVQMGQYLQQGQTAVSIVEADSTWVTANFKETQVGRMAVGMKAHLEVDAYPDADFEGKISSFAAATGSKFALLPPDNASGNFVKVVQRVPVRISVNKNNLADKPLRAGMNIKVVIDLD